MIIVRSIIANRLGICRFGTKLRVNREANALCLKDLIVIMIMIKMKITAITTTKMMKIKWTPDSTSHVCEQK